MDASDAADAPDAADAADATDVHAWWTDDRRRVARVLHDDVVQSMSTALMALGLARMDQPDDPILRDAEQALATSAAALRLLIQDLSVPPSA